MIRRCVKLPIEVECCQWNGCNLDEIKDFVGDDLIAYYQEAKENGNKYDNLSYIAIATLEEEHICTVGDYIIKGVDGEFYPCKKDIFEKTYFILENSTKDISEIDCARAPTQSELEDIFRNEE